MNELSGRQQAEVPYPIGPGAGADMEHDQEFPEVDLLTPLSLRGTTLRNRIVVSPMCRYSATEGMANDWHLVHLGSRAVGGVGALFVEASAVTRDGRISPADMGIWSDEHIEPLARIARFVRRQGSIAGTQLAHAGRKASSDVPWNGGARIRPEHDRRPAVATNPIQLPPDDPPPIALDEE